MSQSSSSDSAQTSNTGTPTTAHASSQNPNQMAAIIPRMYNKKPLRERLYGKFIVHPKTRCWVWTGSRMPTGYGRIGVGRQVQIASRVSWQVHFGHIPQGMNVLHECDNPSCICPEHLFFGTQQQNMQDKVSKGRQRSGESVPSAKLTERTVWEIRDFFDTIIASDETKAFLAEEVGVTVRHINKILSRQVWKHLA